MHIRVALCLGHPNFLQLSLDLRLLAFRQLVEDVGGLVHPAALAFSVVWIDERRLTP
jgi:hypothetical protein